MLKQNKQILKTSITCWHFPKWYESGYSHGKTKNIEIELKCFQSIKILEKKELPNINYYLVLDERNLERFFSEITREIIEKHPNAVNVVCHASGHFLQILMPDKRQRYQTCRMLRFCNRQISTYLF